MRPSISVSISRTRADTVIKFKRAFDADMLELRKQDPDVTMPAGPCTT